MKTKVVKIRQNRVIGRGAFTKKVEAFSFNHKTVDTLAKAC
jgi:hypothetical protein